MKRIFALALALVFVIAPTAPTAKAYNTEELTEEAYLEIVYEIMDGYEDDPETAIAQLAELDTTIVQAPVYGN